MQRIPPELTESARRLRRDMTPAERLLWQQLRDRRPRFTRQLVVDRYILDFACRSVRLGIEIDGDEHAFHAAADQLRTRHIQAHDWIVIRFWNNEIVANLDGVVSAILSAVERAATHPRPLPCREGR